VSRLLGHSPGEMVLIGVQPGSIEMDTELTPEVGAVLQVLVDNILDELKKIGVTCTRSGV
jgi:hydrogenase maturation protease